MRTSGGGFVRLKRSEAEKRQAAQDIRSTEDVVIECLRNARDAGARRIYVAVSRDEAKRSLVVVDDGCGVPENMNDRIFEPRVTSKLDSAHMDKWECTVGAWPCIQSGKRRKRSCCMQSSWTRHLHCHRYKPRNARRENGSVYFSFFRGSRRRSCHARTAKHFANLCRIRPRTP